MKKKLFNGLLLTLMLFTITASAYALPSPYKAHYPRGGRLTLSPMKEKNNTYAFRAAAPTHSRVHLTLIDAHAESGDATVTIQVFVINYWGNWIAFGPPEVVILYCVPRTIELEFPIRQNREFCIVATAYGTSEKCVLPNLVVTS